MKEDIEEIINEELAKAYIKEEEEKEKEKENQPKEDTPEKEQ